MRWGAAHASVLCDLSPSPTNLRLCLPPRHSPHCLAAGGPGEVSAGGQLTWPVGQNGLCGDMFSAPRDHEAGGRFATEEVGGTYEEGGVMEFKVAITAHHNGRFELKVGGCGGWRGLSGQAVRGKAAAPALVRCSRPELASDSVRPSPAPCPLHRLNICRSARSWRRRWARPGCRRSARS